VERILRYDGLQVRQLLVVSLRETTVERNGLHLLTVETEVNEDSKRTNKEVLPWLVRWARRAGTIDFSPALPHRTFFHFIFPHRPATWAGRRAGSPISVSLVSLSKMKNPVLL
jgi:hypothetical protein